MVGRGMKHAWTTIERSAEPQCHGGKCNIVSREKHVRSMVDGVGGLECELQARIVAANRDS